MMTKALILAFSALLPTASLADPVDRLAEIWASEALCGLSASPSKLYELEQDAREKYGIVHSEVASRVREAGNRRINELTLSGNATNFCRNRHDRPD